MTKNIEPDFYGKWDTNIIEKIWRTLFFNWEDADQRIEEEKMKKMYAVDFW